LVAGHVQAQIGLTALPEHDKILSDIFGWRAEA